MFKLQAALGKDFNSTFKTAMKTNKQLQASIQKVNSVQGKIDSYTKCAKAIDTQSQKIQRLNQEHENVVSKLERHKQQAKQLEEAIEKTGDASGELTAQLNKEKNEIERCNEKIKHNESQTKQATAAIDREKSKLEELGQELKKAGVNTENLEGENGRLQKSYEKLRKSQESYQKLAGKQKEINEAIGSTKKKLVGTVGVMGTVATAVYAGPVKSAMTLQQEMKNVGTLLDGDLTSKLSALSNGVLKLSNNTGINTSDLTDGLYQVVSAFGESTESIQQLGVAAKAAKAGGATTTDAINLLSAVTKGYGDTSAVAQQKAADLAFQTVKLGQTDFPSLAASIGKVIPLAATLGTKQEDLFGAMATLTGVTGGTAEVTTQLKATMQGFLSPSKSMEKALQSMGYESGKALLESKGLQGALEVLKDSVGGDELAFAKLFTSVEAQSAVLALAGAQAKNFTEKTKQMYEVAGAAQKAYETATDSTKARIAKAKNSIANLGIILGQNLLPIVGDLADKVSVVVTNVSEFAQANPKLVQTVLKVVAGMAALKVGMLGTKMVSLSTESGILSLVGKLVGLRAGFIENAATSAGFMATLKGAGSSILSYFSNVKGALGGVSSAIGNIFSGNALVGRVAGMLGGVKTALFSGISGIAGRAAGVFTSAGSTMLGYLLRPFTAIGGRLGGILSGLGGIIARSPLGTIGKFIGAGFSKATTLIAPFGNAIKTVLGPIGNLAKTVLGPFGGIAGKILPVVGVFTAIVTVIQLVKNHLEEIRSFIQRTFGDEALAVFDKIVEVIRNIGDTIKGVFSDGNIGAARDKIQELFGDKGIAVFDTLIKVLGTVKNAVSDVVGFIITHVVPVAEQVLQVITTQVIPGIVGFIKAAAPTIMAIIKSIADFIGAMIPVIGSFIAGIMPVISEIIEFISTYVLPIISELFRFICSTVLPAVLAAVQAVLPVVQNVLQTLLPAIQTAVTTIWNVVSPIIQGILAAVKAAMPTILSIVTTVINTMSGVIHGIATVLSGIIAFITGVFTGDWRKAWDGIKSIFSGIWEAIKSVAKGAVNGIISIVNGIIGGLNKLSIPDWVPGLGGKGINIPLIPMLAKGSRNTPDTFIAGEDGPELITNAPGRTVFTAKKTKELIETQRAAQTHPERVKQNIDTAKKTKELLKAQRVAPVQPERVKQNIATAKKAKESIETQRASQVQPERVAPKVAASSNTSNRTTSVTLTSNPTIIVNGDKPNDLDEKLSMHDQMLLQKVKDLLDKRDDDDKRMAYA